MKNYLELCYRAPDMPWVPVLQCWTVPDYVHHAEAYRQAGVDLAALPLVGVGSVCRRQGTTGIRVLMAILQDVGARYHVFGMKVSGLRLCAGYVTSADSLAWSRVARWGSPLPQCPHTRCNNCLAYALRWRRSLLASLGIPGEAGEREAVQPSLFASHAAT